MPAKKQSAIVFLHALAKKPSPEKLGEILSAVAAIEIAHLTARINQWDSRSSSPTARWTAETRCV